MKRNGKMMICLAGGLVFSASAWAVTTDAPGNPYQGIVERNVFALKPPPDPSTLQPAEPEPQKIIPQGITSMFGRQQVLFKTLMPGDKPGAPAQETAMVLSVGQREGEIEVLAIDESTGTITFKNHGKVQEKNLEKDGPKPPAGPPVAPVPAISAPAVPGVLVPTAVNPLRSGAPGSPVITVGGSAGSNLKTIPIPTRTLRLPAATSSGVPALGLGAPATAATTTPTPQPPPPSPEEQAAIMILQKTQNPEGPPIPPIPGLTE